MLNYQKLKGWSQTDLCEWTDREVMLYALGVGVGRDPMNEDELPFVLETRNNLKTLATFPVLHVRWNFLHGYGITVERLLHGESRLKLYRSLPPNGAVNATTTIDEIYDKGPGRGAVLCTRTHGVLADTGEDAFTLITLVFATADGGFGGPSGGLERQRVPDRKPDQVIQFNTHEDQALLYRLSGDRNPLHADPVMAKDFGFPRPILHGLCSYGIAGWVFTRDLANCDPARLTQLDARFTSPVFPGDTLDFDVWHEGETIAWRARVAARNVTCLDDGRCIIKPA